MKTTDSNGRFIDYLIPRPAALSVALSKLTDEEAIALITCSPDQETTTALPVSTLFTKTANNDTLFHRATRHPQSLAILVKKLPEGRRLEALSELDNSGNSVLHKVDNCIALLAELPANLRMNALNIVNKAGLSLLAQLIMTPKTFIPMLGLLTDDEVLVLLKTKSGERSLFDICSYSQYTPLFSPEYFRNSFVPDLITIYRVVQELKNSPKRNSNAFFDLDTKSKVILNKIEQAKSIQEIKEFFIEFLEKNPNSPITHKLLFTSEFDQLHTKLGNLKQAWGMDKPAEEMRTTAP